MSQTGVEQAAVDFGRLVEQHNAASDTTSHAIDLKSVLSTAEYEIAPHRTTITGRSAVILRQHTTPFRPMIVPFDDLELVYQSLRN
jgi:hypothetical protein